MFAINYGTSIIMLALDWSEYNFKRSSAIDLRCASWINKRYSLVGPEGFEPTTKGL